MLGFQHWIGVPLVEKQVHFAVTASILYTELKINEVFMGTDISLNGWISKT